MGRALAHLSKALTPLLRWIDRVKNASLTLEKALAVQLFADSVVAVLATYLEKLLGLGQKRVACGQIRVIDLIRI